MLETAPPSIVSFNDIETLGAQNPVRVKFMTGFNNGLRNAREGQVMLAGIARASRSVPFLAGYDAGRLAWQTSRPQTTTESTAALDEALRFYLSNNHGTDLAWDSSIILRG